MKMIQTLIDMEGLKATNKLSRPYIKVIEQQFREWHEVKGIEVEISLFCYLRKRACIIWKRKRMWHICLIHTVSWSS